MDFSNNSFGWNDAIKKDSEDRVLIPEGNYNARVLWVDRGEFPGSAKLSACPKAIVNLMVDVDGRPMPIIVQLLLHRRLEWKIKEFFRAVGRAKQKAGKGAHLKIEDFYDVLAKAVDFVLQAGEKEKARTNFVTLLEAIVAYHKSKAEGGL